MIQKKDKNFILIYIYAYSLVHKVVYSRLHVDNFMTTLESCMSLNISLIDFSGSFAQDLKKILINFSSNYKRTAKKYYESLGEADKKELTLYLKSLSSNDLHQIKDYYQGNSVGIRPNKV
jgi:formate dehydrogenase maturation protein FdhE